LPSASQTTFKDTKAPRFNIFLIKALGLFLKATARHDFHLMWTSSLDQIVLGYDKNENKFSSSRDL